MKTKFRKKKLNLVYWVFYVKWKLKKSRKHRNFIVICIETLKTFLSFFR